MKKGFFPKLNDAQWRKLTILLLLMVLAALGAFGLMCHLHGITILGEDSAVTRLRSKLTQEDEETGKTLPSVNIYVSSDVIEENRPDFVVALLTPNDWSRPQRALEKVNGIVIHYVANPGSSAMDNRNYFEGLKDSQTTYASSHFIVGLEGEVVQCVPTSEMSYASNSRNVDTVAIEVCHPDETGKFSDVTYASLVQLTGWLCEYLQVEPENIIRHYDVTGKPCPLYYVEHEDAWQTFREDVCEWISQHQ